MGLNYVGHKKDGSSELAVFVEMTWLCSDSEACFVATKVQGVNSEMKANECYGGK